MKVVHEDNETSPQAAVQAARKLVDSDNASCITGGPGPRPTRSRPHSRLRSRMVSCRSPRPPRPTRSRISTTTGCSTAPPRRIVPGPDLANTIADSMGGAQGKTINIGARNDAYGTGLTQTFGEAWKDLGGGVGQRGHLRPRAAELQLGGRQITPATRRLRDHRFPGDLREGRPRAAAHGQLGSEEDVHHRRARLERADRGHRPRGERHAGHGPGRSRQGRGVERVRQALHGATRRISTGRRSTRSSSMR